MSENITSSYHGDILGTQRAALSDSYHGDILGTPRAALSDGTFNMLNITISSLRFTQFTIPDLALTPMNFISMDSSTGLLTASSISSMHNLDDGCLALFGDSPTALIANSLPFNDLLTLLCTNAPPFTIYLPMPGVNMSKQQLTSDQWFRLLHSSSGHINLHTQFATLKTGANFDTTPVDFYEFEFKYSAMLGLEVRSRKFSSSSRYRTSEEIYKLSALGPWDTMCGFTVTRDRTACSVTITADTMIRNRVKELMPNELLITTKAPASDSLYKLTCVPILTPSETGYSLLSSTALLYLMTQQASLAQLDALLVSLAQLDSSAQQGSLAQLGSLQGSIALLDLLGHLALLAQLDMLLDLLTQPGSFAQFGSLLDSTTLLGLSTPLGSLVHPGSLVKLGSLLNSTCAYRATLSHAAQLSLMPCNSLPCRTALSHAAQLSSSDARVPLRCVLLSLRALFYVLLPLVLLVPLSERCALLFLRALFYIFLPLVLLVLLSERCARVSMWRSLNYVLLRLWMRACIHVACSCLRALTSMCSCLCGLLFTCSGCRHADFKCDAGCSVYALRDRLGLAHSTQHPVWVAEDRAIRLGCV